MTMLKVLFPVLLLGLVMGAAQATAPRTQWLYQGGLFENTRGTTWVEKNFDGSFSFREVRRNSEFIELYDQSRDVSVRLYADKCYGLFPNNPSWILLYAGGWRE